VYLSSSSLPVQITMPKSHSPILLLLSTYQHFSGNNMGSRDLLNSSTSQGIFIIHRGAGLLSIVQSYGAHTCVILSYRPYRTWPVSCFGHSTCNEESFLTGNPFRTLLRRRKDGVVKKCRTCPAACRCIDCDTGELLKRV
jgi:hypothetical protein